VKQISIFVIGVATACASAPAPAQDLTAGKTPAQLFRSDCAECHRSPSAVAGTRDVRVLADFLREHYTTRSETAGALAAYVSGFAGSGRRNRGDSEGTASGGDARSKAKLIEDPAARHRRTTSLSGNGDTRAAEKDDDVPRPSRAIRRPASSKSNARTRDAASREGDPISRLRSYLPSAPENEIGEASKGGAPKVRKRRNRANAAPPAADVAPKD